VRLLRSYILRLHLVPFLLGFGVVTFILVMDTVFDHLDLIVTRGVPVLTVAELFLLSLGGFPPTVGFIGKWYIFNAAIQVGTTGMYTLAILGVLTSVVSVFFYLRIVVMMYMSDEHAPEHRPVVSGITAFGLLLALAGVIYLGVLPGRLLSIAADSVASIF